MSVEPIQLDPDPLAPYPADTIVEVNALALPELMIEIEAIAVEG